MTDQTLPWFATDKYSVLELILFAVGCLGWVVAYVAVLVKVRQRRFVEIPAGAVAANIAWEFVWGFIYTSDMGRFFSLGYRIWFFLDLFIVFQLLRYGTKQVSSPLLKEYFRPAFAFGVVAWGVCVFFMGAGTELLKGEGFDTGYGAYSGYILNVMMSALYVTLIVRHHELRDFSLVVAWSKMLGTAVLTIFNFMVQPGKYYLWTLCIATLVLDLLYIAVFYRLLRERRPERSREP